jgi:hypothetical protein
MNGYEPVFLDGAQVAGMPLFEYLAKYPGVHILTQPNSEDRVHADERPISDDRQN